MKLDTPMQDQLEALHKQMGDILAKRRNFAEDEQARLRVPTGDTDLPLRRLASAMRLLCKASTWGLW